MQQQTEVAHRENESTLSFYRPQNMLQSSTSCLSHHLYYPGWGISMKLLVFGIRETFLSSLRAF